MPITIDIEKDYLYQLGIQQERERAKLENARLLKKIAKRLEEEQAKVIREKKKSIAKMSKAGLSQEMIAIFLNLSLEKVHAFLKEIQTDKYE